MHESAEPKPVKGHCFVLMPFNPDNDRIYAAIKSTVEDCGYDCARADELSTDRAIMQDIWDRILSADVIVAELTGRNPNVFYELGLVHSINKHVVLLTRSAKSIPFDIAPLRCVVYDKGPSGEQRLSQKLKETLLSVNATEERFSLPFWKRNDDTVTLLSRMGIRTIYRDRSQFDKVRGSLLESAHDVAWLSIVPDLPAPFDLVDTVLKHLKRGCNFRIMGWNPGSRYRPLLEKSPELFPGMIPPISTSLTAGAVGRLKILVKRHQGPGRLDVRLYDPPPTWYIQVIDDTMFVEPYLYRQQGIHTLMLQLDNTGEHRNPFRYFSLHFDTLFETAHKVVA